MSGQFTIQRATRQRKSFGIYEYEILKGSSIIAQYWHDYRGDEHGIKLADGTTEDWPVGCMTDFLHGGGPEPVTLSPAAIEWLTQRVAL
ncbi:MAG: hypothetical protein CMJ48_03370 [Planctomycetaceae bacterium]|nr:hypothetical protein [Planctomycetaceae bacterium]